MHVPKFEDHGNIKKVGVAQTNASVFLMYPMTCGFARARDPDHTESTLEEQSLN